MRSLDPLDDLADEINREHESVGGPQKPKGNKKHQPLFLSAGVTDQRNRKLTA